MDNKPLAAQIAELFIGIAYDDLNHLETQIALKLIDYGYLIVVNGILTSC